MFFGQIKDVKGLDILLKGFALARTMDASLRLLIGGRVWKTDFSKYQEIIESHGLAPYCALHIHHIPDAEVPCFYRRADLVVLPHLRIYQSDVDLGAMSYGSAVLVSDIAGMLEAVVDESTSFVFRSRDARHLAQRIGEIFSNPGTPMASARRGCAWSPTATTGAAWESRFWTVMNARCVLPIEAPAREDRAPRAAAALHAPVSLRCRWGSIDNPGGLYEKAT